MSGNTRLDFKTIIISELLEFVINFTGIIFCSGFIHNSLHVICNYFIRNTTKCFKCIIKKRKEYILCFRK